MVGELLGEEVLPLSAHSSFLHSILNLPSCVLPNTVNFSFLLHHVLPITYFFPPRLSSSVLPFLL